jgi:hypothetical protein
LAVLSLGTGVASPRKSDFVPWRRGSDTSNRSEVNANVTFMAKLSSKETYLKMVLRLGLIESNCLSHTGCSDNLELV